MYSRLKGKNLRQHRRYKVGVGLMQLYWVDMNGNAKAARTRILDISEDGMSLLLPEAAMPVRVRFHSDRYNVRGLGIVRYCKSAGPNFVIGVQFTENLHWSPPEDEVSEPIPLCGTDGAAVCRDAH
jgi:hypothetical protein